MKTFKDNKGREWQIDINVAAIKRVRSLLRVDLLEIVEGKLIERLMRDPILLCDVIYAVCKLQADELKISDEDFGRAMAGDAIDLATTALLEDLVSFSPSPKDRQNLGRVLKTTQEVMDRSRQLVTEKIDSGFLDRIADKELALIRQEIERANAGDSSGNAPASSASIPPS